MQIRHATVHDVPSMGKIINDAAEYGLMLHRSMSHLYEHVREFYVAQDHDKIVGVCGLSVVWANLAEVYSLAVSTSHRRRGIGQQLVKACIEDAKRLGIPRLMVLTYEQRFFDLLGFTVCDRQQLPLKVWSECLRCSKNQACDEIAMICQLEDVPAAPVPQPGTPSPGTYEVPVTLGVTKGQSSSRKKMDEAH